MGKFNIAGIIIEVDETHELGQLVYQDLKNDFFETSSKVNIKISFVEQLNIESSIHAGKYFLFNETETLIKNLPFFNYKYFIHNDVLYINVALKSVDIVNKLKIYLHGKKNILKNNFLSYGLFWFVFQNVLLMQSKTFLHAGVFSENGEGFAICGSGGSGKTSTLFKILEDENKKYLAEDFAIIDIEAMTYYNTKPLSIYKSDIEYGACILRKIYKKLNLVEKIRWNIKSKILRMNPMIKVNPFLILNDKIEKEVKLKNIFFFIRGNKFQALNYKIIDNVEMAERNVSVALREMKTYIEILHQLNANKESRTITVDEYKNNIFNIYKKVFEKTKNILIEVPEKIKPEEIITFLKKEDLI